MGTVVELALPPEQFALAETSAVVPDATFEAVRVAAHDHSSALALLHASSNEVEELDSAIRNDSTVEDTSCLLLEDDQALYRITWRQAVEEVLEVLLRRNGTLLAAQKGTDKWRIRLLFPDRVVVSKAYKNWRRHGLDLSVRRVNGVSDMTEYNGIALSPCQQETLIEAFQMNYYDVPRSVTLEDLANDLDVTHQALSERLRRGHRNLIGSTLCEPPANLNRSP